MPVVSPIRSSSDRQREILSLPYGTRIAIARKSAREGYGFEDLMILFNISESDARRIVFGREG